MTVSKRAVAAAAGAVGVALLLARRGARDVTSDRARTSRTVTIRRDAAELQRTFTDPARLPEFFRGVTSVEPIDATHQRWTFATGTNKRMPVDMEIVDDTPGKRFAWRAAKHAPFAGGGSLTVTAAPGDRGTQVRLALHVDGTGAKAAAAFYRLFGASPAQISMESLRSFKALTEAGEIPTAARS
jgi:uncharacterized membrane protein